MKTRRELDADLDNLEVHLPTLLAETRAEDQMEAFAGIADEIREQASPEDADHVWSRLQCILRDAGLVPGDEEPCAD